MGENVVEQMKKIVDLIQDAKRTGGGARVVPVLPEQEAQVATDSGGGGHILTRQIDKN